MWWLPLSVAAFGSNVAERPVRAVDVTGEPDGLGTTHGSITDGAYVSVVPSCEEGYEAEVHMG